MYIYWNIPENTMILCFDSYKKPYDDIRSIFCCFKSSWILNPWWVCINCCIFHSLPAGILWALLHLQYHCCYCCCKEEVLTEFDSCAKKVQWYWVTFYVHWIYFDVQHIYILSLMHMFSNFVIYGVLSKRIICIYMFT